MHGATQPVELEGEFLGIHKDPWGRDKAVVSATGNLNREQWGLTWNQALETGGVLLGSDIRLEIEAQFLRR
jgi:polyisoprenoid-binding protein YceI